MLRTSRHTHQVRSVVATIAAFALVSGLLGLGAAPAQAAIETQVGIDITATSPTPQKSGTPFTYDLDFNCDLLGSGGGGESGNCDAPVIEIPLGADLEALLAAGDLSLDDFDVSGSEYIDSFEVVDGKLVIHMKDVPVGESIQFQLQIKPPNYTTPNGTEWSFEPEVTGGNFEPVTVDEPADGEATATLNHTVNKSVVGNAFREPGDEVTYQIEVACSQAATGTILAESMHVSDSIPANMTYVSSMPAAAGAPAGPLTWNLDGTELPASCAEKDGNGSVTLQVVLKVDDDAPYGTQITNTAGVTSTTTDGQDIAEKTDNAAITVIDADDPTGPAGVGDFEKYSFAQLRDDDAPASGSGAGLESESHTTYPGNWLGALANQSGNPLSGFTPNQATGMRQAGYKMDYRSSLEQGSGFQIDITDPVPCYTNKTDQVYASNALGTLCADPAFHVKTVSAWSSTAGDVPAITSGWAPQVRYSDNTTADMIASPAQGSNNVNFAIPDSPKVVSEVIFPRDAGLSGPTVRWAVFGFVDQRVDDGEIVKDQAQAKIYWKNQTTARATDIEDADIYVVKGPQIGIEKDLGGLNASGTDQTSLKLTSRLATTGTATQDFIVTDLLPTGMTVSGTPPTPQASVTHLDTNGVTPATDTVAGAVEVVDNFQGSGRQLVRITFAKESLADFGSLKLETTSTLTVGYGNEPGTYNNTAEVYYTDDALLSTCQQSPAYAQNADEAFDLNGNDSTQDNNCYSKDSLTIPPPTGGAAYKTTKTVQGDSDDAPKAYPAIGTVTEIGGTVTFGLGWKNTGGVPLTGAVIYDVFPVPGDVGVGGSVAGVPRNSDFKATLTGAGSLPANVTIEYSTASNPCRPEVFANADNPGCVDDWTSTRPPVDDVTAIKLASTTTYAPGEGFTVDVEATTPQIEPGQIAWNSIAGAASRTDGTALNPNSPPKVGITSSTTVLPLLLAKTLDSSVDPATVKVGDTVTYHLSISNPDLATRTLDAEDTMPAGLEFESITGESGAPVDKITQAGGIITWTGQEIPSGGTYTWTVKAKVIPGAVGTLTNQFGSDDGTSTTNVCEDDPDQECVGVYVAPVTLAIAKSVDGNGAQFAPDDFPVTLTCHVPPATDPVVDETFNLADGAERDFAVPQGTSCSVEETDDGGATHATYSVNGTSYQAGDEFPVGNTSIDISIKNTFDAGVLVINKKLDGVGADLATKKFTFTAACTFQGDPVPGFPQDVDLTPVAGQTTLTSDELGPLPVGAHCVVTESDRGDADQTPDPIEVDIFEGGDGTISTAEVTFTNEFSAGTISVAKELSGDYADTGALDDTEFTLSVTCTYEGTDLFTRSVVLKGGERVTIDDTHGDPVKLPVGTTCSADEPDSQGASEPPTISAPVTVTAGSPTDLQDLTLTATNVFDAGSLQIRKDITGVGADLAEGPFVFDVACTFRGDPVPGFPQQITLVRTSNAATIMSDPLGPLPVGASCITTETGNGGADVTPSPTISEIVKNSDDNTVATTFANPYSAGTIAVTKELDGKYAKVDQLDDQEFMIAVTCELTTGATTTTILDREVTVRGGETKTVTDKSGEEVLLPVGTACWGAETDDGGATESSVDHDDAARAVTVVAGKPGQIQALELTATNTFDQDLWGLTAIPDTGGAPISLLLWGGLLCLAGSATLAMTRRRRV